MMKLTEVMMRRFSAFFLFAAILCSFELGAAEGGEVLWWMVFDMSNVTAERADGTTVTAADLGANAARIRYEGNGTSGFLPIYGVDANNNSHPTMGTGEAANLPGWYFASLGNFNNASYSFVLEIGNWADGTWAGTSMESTAAGYDTLGNHIAVWKDATPVYSTPWSPTSFSVVPEPTSGIMVLVGGALLALRRKRRNA